MGFLTEKSMLVSLLALSLAACTSVPNPPPKVTDPPINVPCDGPDKQDHRIHNIDQTITFQTSGCNLTDVYFTNDVGKAHFDNKQHSGAQFKFHYDGKDLADGAGFYYETDYIKPGTSKDGGGNGVIRNY